MAIDFDGTNDYATVGTGALNANSFFFSLWVKRDAASGQRNIVYLYDSANPTTEYAVLYQSGPTLTFRVFSGGGSTPVNASGTFSANVWHCCQFFGRSTGGTHTIAARFGTGSFATANPSAWPTVDTIELGRIQGFTPGYFNGAIGDLHYSGLDWNNYGTVAGSTTDYPDPLARKYTPMHAIPEIAYWCGAIPNAAYWPMRNTVELNDQLNNYAISYPGVGPATNRGDHPELFGRGARRVIVPTPAVTTRRVSWGGYYKTTGNRVVLVG